MKVWWRRATWPERIMIVATVGWLAALVNFIVALVRFINGP